LQLVAVGLLLGLIAAASLQKAMASQIYGVRALDPVVLLSVMLVLGVVALAACAIPARRAMRVDPMVALRSERSEAKCKIGRLRGRKGIGSSAFRQRHHEFQRGVSRGKTDDLDVFETRLAACQQYIVLGDLFLTFRVDDPECG
jgi:hypothetical protein